MDADLIRRCPSCATENAAQVMRCACGALLAGIDLASPRPAPAAAPAIAPGGAAVDTTCPFDDCAQPNPAGTLNCLYCDRPLAGAPPAPGVLRLHTLVSLPGALKRQYRIVKPLPVEGGEAELLLVEHVDGGPVRVAKVYRHGILPRADVQARIARVDPSHRVELHASGVDDGHAYELMEYCPHGSLRQHMDGALDSAMLAAVAGQLAAALAAVHGAGLLHRDLKPENVLVRAMQPLDLVLTDFGISSVIDATQHFTGVARTLPYCAPESLSGVIDAKSDYWAMGMLLLEAALGAHPFRHLSEAVILHHLTTRNVDLAGVTDRNLRKLLRGLLLRDPKARWGSAEVARWLAADPTLAEPAEAGMGNGFREPYRVASETCHSSEQLAVALARHWRDGVADIANGQLLAWFRDVQKDQNAVRLLIELRQERQMPVDLQLLKLVVHLAPGIPPVWCGEALTLRAILSQANQALRGEAEALRWLDRLYQCRVLETYASAGNQDCAAIVDRWSVACDRFQQAWEAGKALIDAGAPRRGPDDYANFDNLVYGSDGPGRPALADMHARLLACAYDPQWAERLRARTAAELTPLALHCPWLAGLGDVHAMQPSSLLVLDALLPQARQAAQRQLQAIERKRASEADEVAALRLDVQAALAAIRTAAARSLWTRAALAGLDADLDRYLSLLARIRASGRVDLAWMDLRKVALRHERTAGRMHELADELARQRAITAGWLSPNVGVAIGLSAFLLPMFLGDWIAYLMLAAAVGLVLWRAIPLVAAARGIRDCAALL